MLEQFRNRHGFAPTRCRRFDGPAEPNQSPLNRKVAHDGDVIREGRGKGRLFKHQSESIIATDLSESTSAAEFVRDRNGVETHSAVNQPPHRRKDSLVSLFVEVVRL